MLTFNDPGKLQAWCRLRRQKGEKIALIPTMGYLHEGHLSLIAAAKRKNATQIVVSVKQQKILQRARLLLLVLLMLLM